MDNGLRYAYTGNVRDIEGGQTVCHGCGCVLIARDGYDITARRLDDAGRCAICATPCAGVFDRGPGSWGARIAPVHFGRLLTDR